MSGLAHCDRCCVSPPGHMPWCEHSGDAAAERDRLATQARLLTKHVAALEEQHRVEAHTTELALREHDRLTAELTTARAERDEALAKGDGGERARVALAALSGSPVTDWRALAEGLARAIRERLRGYLPHEVDRAYRAVWDAIDASLATAPLDGTKEGTDDHR